MTLESLLIFVAVLAAGFFNIVLPMLKKAQRTALQNPQPGQPQPPDGNGDAHAPAMHQTQGINPEQVKAELPPLAPGMSAPVLQREMPGAQDMPFAAALKRLPAGRTEPGFEPQQRRRSFGDLTEVRRGMVLRVVLGPCRARRPFDARGDWT